MSDSLPPAGWYDDPEDETKSRFWNGISWTNDRKRRKTRVVPTVEVADKLLLEFTCHIEGTNAKARIYDNRVEWERPRKASAGKITAGVLTGGLSLGLTGVRSSKAGSDMIPLSVITGIATKRDGPINTIVTVTTAGNRIGFRVNHKDAQQLTSVLNNLILKRDADQAAPTVVQVQAPKEPVADITDQLLKLGQLRDAGVLTEAEFEAKKTEMLARM